MVSIFLHDHLLLCRIVMRKLICSGPEYTHMKIIPIPLTVLLVLILVSVVSATTVYIPPGGEVFLGEEGLDVRAAVPPPYDAIAFFPAGSSTSREMPLDVRTIDTRRFTVSPQLYMDRIGSWYQWDSRRGLSGSLAFSVREPRASIRIIQQTTMEDISSGTIPRGTALFFQVDTNTGSVAQRPGYNPMTDGIVDLLVTTPGGGVLSGVETMRGSYESLSQITLTGSLQVVPASQTGGWDTGAKGAGGTYLYAAGTYRVEPRFSFNRVDVNIRDTAVDSALRGASVNLGSDRSAISTRDEQVIRGNPVSVTVSGTPGEPVYLWIDARSKSGAPGDQPPMILFAQEGVAQDSPDGPYAIGAYRPESEGGRSIRDLVPREPYGGVKYYAMITPDRDGKRTIEFRTSAATDDTRYTIRIESGTRTGQRHTDDISLTVVKGSVSLVTGKDVYSIGEEVRLSGSNTESCETYLFITGPNLPSGGGRLDEPRQAVRSGDPSSFTVASGDCDTWDYRLYTGELGVDAGTYTIYAVPVPVDRYNLGSVPYQTIPLTLRRPYVSLQNQMTEVARGDSLTLTGYSSSGYHSGVAIWLFGKNFFRYDQADTDRDGSFEYEIPAWMTSDMVAGQYAVIIQHPMGNGQYDIWPDGQRQVVLGRYPYPGAPLFRVGGPGALMGPEAANALITALNSAFIDDTYTRYDVRVSSPRITIRPESLHQEAGYPVVIEGTTNLADGDRLLIEISDNRFVPTKKTDADSSYGYSGTTVVREGDGDRFFSLDIPDARLVPGEYRVIVQAVESEAMTSGLLTITPPVPLEEVTPTPVNITPSATVSQPVNNTTVLTPSPTAVPATAEPTPVQTAPLAPVTPPSVPVSLPDDRLVFLLTGIGFGLLVAGIAGLIILTFRKKKETDAGDEPGDASPGDLDAGDTEEEEETAG